MWDIATTAGHGWVGRSDPALVGRRASVRAWPPSRVVSGWRGMREVDAMLTPRPRGTRRSFVLFSLSIAGSLLCSTLLPSAERIALAKDGYALGDTLILAGPGGQYGILSVAPSGSALSVDGDPV